MNITYLDNAGFFVSLDDITLVFDYYDDGTAKVRTLDNGLVPQEEIARQDNTYVFVTHSHYDHYNTDILDWQKNNPKIRYIFDSEIKKDRSDIIHLKEGQTYKDEKLEVRAFGSTDMGLSFLVNTGGKTFFHAGDLNFWHWDEKSNARFIAKAEKEFMHHLNEIKAFTMKCETMIDVMFFPCDYRMGDNGDQSARRMISAFSPAVFVPMHFQNRFDKIAAFKEKYENKDTTIWAIPRRGAQLYLA